MFGGTFDGESLGRPGPIRKDGLPAHRNDGGQGITRRGSSECCYDAPTGIPGNAERPVEQRPDKTKTAGSIPAPGSGLERIYERIAAEYEDEGATATLERGWPSDPGLGDWWAIEVEEQVECVGCGFTSPYYWESLPSPRAKPQGRKMFQHLVIVFPGDDDPNLLRLCAETKGLPAPFEGDDEECASYYELVPS